MPEAEIKKRGGAKKWRTIKLPDGSYERVAIVRKRGPRGGQTVAGPVRRKKDPPKKHKKINPDLAHRKAIQESYEDIYGYDDSDDELDV